jgi:transposase-like protein
MEKAVKQTASQVVKEIKRRARRKFSADEKIKIVLEGLRGEVTHTYCSKCSFDIRTGILKQGNMKKK